MQSIQLADFDVEGLRARLRKMSDEELRKFGKAARYMTSPNGEYGQSTAANFRPAVRGSSCGVAPKRPTALDVKIDALQGIQKSAAWQRDDPTS